MSGKHRYEDAVSGSKHGRPAALMVRIGRRMELRSVKVVGWANEPVSHTAVDQ